jgi:hypothetical protein
MDVGRLFRFGAALFFVIAFISCAPSLNFRQGVFYALAPTGEFVAARELSSLGAAEFVPWPQQVRVTDMLVRGDRLFLAVNGHGLAEVLAANDKVSFSAQYAETFFSGRTVTRLFPVENALYCHVYFDAAFAGTGPLAASGQRIGLLRFRPDTPDAGFVPVALTILPPAEAWEAVVARPLDERTIALEWKLSGSDRSAFRYSEIDLSSGAEIEKDRTWFYDTARPAALASASLDPALKALLKTLAETLARETADCRILFTSYDPVTGREIRTSFTNTADPKSEATIYYSIRVTAVSEGYLALLPDGRYWRVGTADERSWRQGRLPELKPPGRYTLIAFRGEWLCAAWEEVDFFRVGRAGVFLRRE